MDRHDGSFADFHDVVKLRMGVKRKKVMALIHLRADPFSPSARAASRA
jgi:hypothetical protein